MERGRGALREGFGSEGVNADLVAVEHGRAQRRSFLPSLSFKRIFDGYLGSHSLNCMKWDV